MTAPSAYAVLAELVAAQNAVARHWSSANSSRRTAAWDAARACVARGDVTVPREPTEAMIDAGVYAYNADFPLSDLLTAI